MTIEREARGYAVIETHESGFRALHDRKRHPEPFSRNVTAQSIGITFTTYCDACVACAADLSDILRATNA